MQSNTELLQEIAKQLKMMNLIKLQELQLNCYRNEIFENGDGVALWDKQVEDLRQEVLH